MADYECHNIFPSSEYCFILSQNTAYRYDFIYFKNIPLYIYHINILFYHSQKYKLIALCIAMGMSVKETDRALLLANQPKLSPKIQKDAALIICINQSQVPLCLQSKWVSYGCHTFFRTDHTGCDLLWSSGKCADHWTGIRYQLFQQQQDYLYGKIANILYFKCYY